MDSVRNLVPFVLIIAAVYVLIIRPARNRQRAQQRLGDQLAVGSRVMTTSGLFAEVVGFEDGAVLLEASPGVTMRWTKAAVARILPEPDAGDDSGDDSGNTETGTGTDAADTDAADAAPDPDGAERPS